MGGQVDDVSCNRLRCWGLSGSVTKEFAPGVAWMEWRIEPIAEFDSFRSGVVEEPGAIADEDGEAQPCALSGGRRTRSTVPEGP